MEILEKKFVQVTDKTTVCALVLKNGFEIIGVTTCGKDKFDKEKGEDIAYFNALRKLKGYQKRRELKEEKTSQQEANR